MGTVARKPESSFTPASEGLHAATLIDVVDRGIVTGKFGPKHEVELRFVVDELSPQGKPLVVRQKYTLSMNEKAKLRKTLESWRGKKYTNDEAEAGIDLDTLIGKGAQVQVEHTISTQGKTFANVINVIPLGKGQSAPTAPADYVRQQDRDNEGDAMPQDSYDEPTGGDTVTDDDIPF